MFRNDRTALICDLAESYGVTDYRKLPAETLAALAVGLRENSRSKLALSGCKVPKQEMMLAAILDGVNRAVWLLSAICPKDGQQPKSILRAILGEEEAEDGQDAVAFDTPEEYEQEWERLTGIKHGG